MTMLARRPTWRSWWIGVYNSVWWPLHAGPAYYFYGNSRPSVWARITADLEPCRLSRKVARKAADPAVQVAANPPILSGFLVRCAYCRRYSELRQNCVGCGAPLVKDGV